MAFDDIDHFPPFPGFGWPWHGWPRPNFLTAPEEKEPKPAQPAPSLEMQVGQRLDRIGEELEAIRRIVRTRRFPGEEKGL